MESVQRISIAKKEDRMFFHVIGESVEYMDLDYLLRKHPEMSEEVESRRFDLERKMYRAREESNAFGGLLEGART